MMRLAFALIGLSRRERLMVALLLLLAVPAALWLVVAQPLLAGRDVARTALAEAEDLRAWVIARRAELAALPSPAGPAGPTAPVGLAGIEARLQDAGLTPAGTGGTVQLSDSGQDGVGLRFERVDFALLMDWLIGAEAEAGYRIASLVLSAGPVPGQVAADIRLEPAP